MLERLVHALMSSVLFGVAWLDEFGIDAESHPPNGEAAESSDGGGGERNSVVGADDLRETEVFEEVAEHGLARVTGILATPLLVDHAVTRKQVADGGARWSVDLRVSLRKDREQLLRTPVGMSAT